MEAQGAPSSACRSRLRLSRESACVVFVVLFGASCGDGPSPSTTFDDPLREELAAPAEPAAPVEPAAPADDAAPVEPAASPCEVIERAQRASLAAVACPGLPDPFTADTQRALRTCVPTRDGAWGLVLEPASVEHGCEPSAFGFVTPPPNAGAARAEYVSNGVVTKGSLIAWRSLGDVRGFDYDGDGEAELLVEGRSAERWAAWLDGLKVAPFGFALVLRADAGAIGPLASTAGMSALGFDDVDGDGRPDLVVTPLLTGRDGDVSSWTFEGPKTVAHSLPGGAFSTDDAVAADVRRRACAKSATLERAHAVELFAAAVCARVHGAPVAEVVTRYERRCRQMKPEWGWQSADEDISIAAVCDVHAASAEETVLGVPENLQRLLATTTPLVGVGSDASE